MAKRRNKEKGCWSVKMQPRKNLWFSFDHTGHRCGKTQMPSGCLHEFVSARLKNHALADNYFGRSRATNYCKRIRCLPGFGALAPVRQSSAIMARMVQHHSQEGSPESAMTETPHHHLSHFATPTSQRIQRNIARRPFAHSFRHRFPHTAGYALSERIGIFKLKNQATAFHFRHPTLQRENR